MTILGIDPYKTARMHGRIEMRDEILKVMSEAALFADARESDLLWDLIEQTKRIAMEDE